MPVIRETGSRRTPALKRDAEPSGHLRCKRLARLRDEALVGQPGGMAEQKPRIELGRLDPRLAQKRSRPDEGRAQGDGLCFA